MQICTAIFLLSTFSFALGAERDAKQVKKPVIGGGAVGLTATTPKLQSINFDNNNISSSSTSSMNGTELAKLAVSNETEKVMELVDLAGGNGTMGVRNGSEGMKNGTRLELGDLDGEKGKKEEKEEKGKKEDKQEAKRDERKKLDEEGKKKAEGGKAPMAKPMPKEPEEDEKKQREEPEREESASEELEEQNEPKGEGGGGEANGNGGGNPMDGTKGQERMEAPEGPKDGQMHEFLASSEESHAFRYLVMLALLLAALYLAAHNRKKIMGCLLEGRSGRRNGTARYRRLSQGIEGEERKGDAGDGEKA